MDSSHELTGVKAAKTEKEEERRGERTMINAAELKVFQIN